MTTTTTTTSIHWRSQDLKWETPKYLIDDLAPLFPWDLDVAASRPNVCKSYLTEHDNALTTEWAGLCWCNPPYGRQIALWYAAAQRNIRATTVMLVPARTDTSYWHTYVPYSSMVVFIKGRVKFGSAAYWRSQNKKPESAPFPSAFVVFESFNLQYRLTLAQRQKLAGYGLVVNFRPPNSTWDPQITSEFQS